MYFDLTDEQQAIKSTAHDFLAARYKSERIRELADSEDGFERVRLGGDGRARLAGLALPEEWGGQGLGIVELAVLFEEMGYALAPSPLLLEHDRRPGARRSAAPTSSASATCGRWPTGELRGTPALWDAGSPGDARRVHDGGARPTATASSSTARRCW